MSPPDSDASARFDLLERKVVDSLFELNPSLAVGLGVHEYDGRLPPIERDATDAWLRRSDQLLAELRHGDPDRLGAGRQIDRRLLELALEGCQFDLRESAEYDRNPMGYFGALSLTAYTVRPYAPLAARGEAMLRVLQAVPAWLRTAERRLRPELPLPFVQIALSMGQGLPQHFADCEQRLGPELEELAGRFRKAREPAADAVRAFHRALEERFLPRASPEFALGEAHYRRLLWVREGISLSPEELRARGEADLRRNQERLEAIVRSAPPARTVTAYMERIGDDHGSAEELLPETRRCVAETERWIRESGLISLPSSVLCRVEETPAFARALSTASMNPPGPFEAQGSDGVYYVTTVDPAWTAQQQEQWLRTLCRPILRNVTVHEVYPGHYLQFLHLRQSSASLARRCCLSASFTEGWAHYCEQLAIEEGFGAPGTPAEAVQLQDALLRDCRLIVSVGLHCQGMSLAQGAEFFRREAHLEPLNAERETMRGTFNPEYYCYTLGKLEILRLRGQRADSGPGSLRRFHDRLLSFGCPPVGLLEGLLASEPSAP
ncbi:MAG: DUF885 domain-containing protein [Thermoplasmata archaeon]|nr:DUF885 domain-containing protein [Thermoplasmata archaeon]